MLFFGGVKNGMKQLECTSTCWSGERIDIAAHRKDGAGQRTVLDGIGTHKNQKKQILKIENAITHCRLEN